MANGIINFSSDNNKYEVRAVWSAYSPIPSNYSNFTYTIQVRKTETSPSFSSVYVKYYISVFNGNGDVAFTTSNMMGTSTVATEVALNGTQWVNVYSETKAIYHNYDGTLSLFEDSGSVVQVGTATAVITTALSGYVTLTFDRAFRGAYITSAPNFTDKDNPTIKYINNSGAYNLQACISLTGSTEDIAYRDIPTNGGSYTFELTAKERETLINAIGANGVSKTVYFFIKSYQSGYIQFYNVGRTFSLTDYKPSVTPTVADMNDVTTTLTGDPYTLIRYHSKAAAQINAIAKKGATIVREKITNGTQVAERGLAAFDNVESGLFVFEATDSRGDTTTVEYQAPFIEYSAPTIQQKVEIEFDETSETYAKVHLELTGSWYNGSFGAQNNGIVVQFRHTDGDGNWGNWINIQDVIWEMYIEGNTFKVSGTVSQLDYSKPYSFQSRVIDSLDIATTTEYPVKLVPVFDWSETDFNFNVPVSIEGAPIADYVIEYGTEPMGTNGTWYWSKWKSGKAECYGARNYGKMAITTYAAGFYWSSRYSQSLPNGLFAQAPEYIDINCQTANVYSGIFVERAAGETEPTATSTDQFCLMCANTYTLPKSVLSFHCLGRWK